MLKLPNTYQHTTAKFQAKYFLNKSMGIDLGNILIIWFGLQRIKLIMLKRNIPGEQAQYNGCGCPSWVRSSPMHHIYWLCMKNCLPHGMISIMWTIPMSENNGKCKYSSEFPTMNSAQYGLNVLWIILSANNTKTPLFNCHYAVTDAHSYREADWGYRLYIMTLRLR